MASEAVLLKISFQPALAEMGCKMEQVFPGAQCESLQGNLNHKVVGISATRGFPLVERLKILGVGGETGGKSR